MFRHFSATSVNPSLDKIPQNSSLYKTVPSSFSPRVLPDIELPVRVSHSHTLQSCLSRTHVDPNVQDRHYTDENSGYIEVKSTNNHKSLKKITPSYNRHSINVINPDDIIVPMNYSNSNLYVPLTLPYAHIKNTNNNISPLKLVSLPKPIFEFGKQSRSSYSLPFSDQSYPDVTTPNYIDIYEDLDDMRVLLFGIGKHAKNVASMLYPEYDSVGGDLYLEKIRHAYQSNPIEAESIYKLAATEIDQYGPAFGNLQYSINYFIQ